MTLTGKEKHKLRGMAHGLKPVVMIGNRGLTEAVLVEIDRALTDHELIKIKVSGVEKREYSKLIDRVCRTLQAAWVQTVGHVMVFYRKSEKDKH